MLSKYEVLNILKKFKIERGSLFHVDKLGLFGSVARNEHDESSDVDVFMTYTEPLDYFQLGTMKKELETILNCKVDLVTLHENLLKSFVNNLKKDAIYV